MVTGLLQVQTGFNSIMAQCPFSVLCIFTLQHIRSAEKVTCDNECCEHEVELGFCYRADFSKFDPSLDPELDDDQRLSANIPALATRKAPPSELHVHV